MSDDSFETIKEEAKAGQPESALPANHQTDGEAIIEGLQKLIEGKPVLTVCSALTATLFIAATNEGLNREAKEALSVMVADLAMNVLNTNEISGERLAVIMAQRGGVEVHASALGAVLMEQAEPSADQEQG